MCEGRITGEFMSGEATQNKILERATQFEAKGIELGHTGREEAV
jgi:hypothetical protein